MASLKRKPARNTSHCYELESLPASQSQYDAREIPNVHRHQKTHSLDEREQLLHATEVSCSSTSLSSKPPPPPLPNPIGKPTAKKRFHFLDLSAAGLSVLCLVLAIVAVADESISWRLGVGNYQLIVIGFLLSIMNLCLGSVSPTLFLLLEARFGSSMLQNYDGILRNKPLSSRLGLVWRLVLGLYLALPLGLSASYKSFAGGESAMMVNAATYTGNTSYYGMFGPPGLQLLGQNTGVSLFSNATLPFAMGTSSQKGPEPPVPKHAQAYGFNVLMLNDESTAILDIPQPSYVSAVQGLLGGRESWNITAPVFATVATFNHSKTKNEDAFESNFEDFCEAAEDSSGAYTHKSMLNEWAVGLVNHASPGDQSLQYVGLSPDPGIEHRPSCSEFSHYAQPYDVNRQFCKGTWSITRGGIQLANGSCNGTNLAPTQQQIITNNSLFPGVWYMSSLVEFLGPFAVERNESKWVRSYMATGIAAMLWSRIIAIDCSSILQGSHDDPYMFHNLTYKDAGLIYPVKDIAVHIRPTLRKSSWLYFLLATQPLLIIGMLGMTLMLHSTPLDNGFGLISILSGIDRRGLDVLAGAALSGELVRTVKLTMNPLHDDEKGTIQYDVVLPSTVSPHNGRLAPKIVYH